MWELPECRAGLPRAMVGPAEACEEAGEGPEDSARLCLAVWEPLSGPGKRTGLRGSELLGWAPPGRGSPIAEWEASSTRSS